MAEKLLEDVDELFEEGKPTWTSLTKTIGMKIPKFLEKIEAMPPEMFSVKQPSPINYFAINNDVKGIEEYFSQDSQTVIDGTDDANSEVITYVSFIL